MAMTTKGIQYFSLDVNFFEDDRIAVIISDYGFEAVAVTLKLFSQIYKNGFYMKWNEKTCKVFTASFRSSFSSEMIDHLVHDLVKELVFEPSLFEKHQILTSKAIQRNYFEAVCRRKNFDVENVEYLLVEIPKSKMNRKNVDKNVENADKNTKNADIFQQRKEKESKEKKSKEDMDTSCCARQGETKYGFPDLCRRYRAELERDEDWLFAVSQLSGLGGAEIVRRIAGAMDIFETHIVSTGEHPAHQRLQTPLPVLVALHGIRIERKPAGAQPDPDGPQGGPLPQDTVGTAGRDARGGKEGINEN